MRTHGTISSYNRGCRCEECTRAARDARRRQRTRYHRGDYTCTVCPASFSTERAKHHHENRVH